MLLGVGGVDIDDAASISIDKHGRQNPHITRQHDIAEVFIFEQSQDFFIVVCAFLLGLARWPWPTAEWMLGVVVGNGLWAIAAFGLLASDAFAATAWGQAYLALHGLGVLLLATAVWLAWRHACAVSAGRVARA